MQLEAEGGVDLQWFKSKVTSLPVFIGQGKQSGLKDNAKLKQKIESALVEHGSVLIRKFGLKDAADFRKTLCELNWSFKDYVEGGSPRTEVLEGIFTSTEYSKEYPICMHNELSYTAKPPSKLSFFCEISAGNEGQTPILDCGRVIDELPADLVKEFREKSVMYIRNIPQTDGLMGKSWNKTFNTDSKDKVEEILTERNVTFEWTPSGLRTQQVRPATIQHPVSDETIWFNQCDLWHYSSMGDKGRQMIKLFGLDSAPTHSKFGDGTEIPEEYIEKVKSITNKSSLIFDWVAGDILILDNFWFAHGRTAYKRDRKILVAMA
jgi:alpha-ketoglutarate-dependent taurine dioxygenase